MFIEQYVETIPTKSIIKKLGAQPSVLQQTNTSSIYLEVNSKKSSTKQIGHINIRYFYVTDKVRSRDVVVLYHATEEMVVDFLTKLLNGTPFRTHWNNIMGLYKISIAQYKAQYENAKYRYRNCIGM